MLKWLKHLIIYNYYWHTFVWDSTWYKHCSTSNLTLLAMNYFLFHYQGLGLVRNNVFLYLILCIPLYVSRPLPYSFCSSSNSHQTITMASSDLSSWILGLYKCIIICVYLIQYYDLCFAWKMLIIWVALISAESMHDCSNYIF